MRSLPPALLCLALAAACAPEGVSDITPDAGSGPAPLNAPCQADEDCAPPGQCIPYGEGGLCVQECTTTADCPTDAACLSGACTWTGGTVGESCSQDMPCHPGLACQETPAGAFCTRACDYLTPCPTQEDARCVKLSQGTSVCLRNCGDDSDCAPALKCVPLRSAPVFLVCYPGS